jgi:uncharacterized protein (DUF488 family)
MNADAHQALIYTVGHSNHPIEKLIALLAPHGVRRVVDVRSQPYSRFNPQYRREALAASLDGAGIAYEFLGRELGARTTDDDCYVDDRVDYERLAAAASFAHGIARVTDAAAGERLALLCAERDPLTCHRAILVCRRLQERGVDAHHILANGSLETHANALERLVIEEGLEGGDLFRDREALLADAYRRRGKALAYARKP